MLSADRRQGLASRLHLPRNLRRLPLPDRHPVLVRPPLLAQRADPLLHLLPGKRLRVLLGQRAVQLQLQVEQPRDDRRDHGVLLGLQAGCDVRHPSERRDAFAPHTAQQQRGPQLSADCAPGQRRAVAQARRRLRTAAARGRCAAAAGPSRGRRPRTSPRRTAGPRPPPSAARAPPPPVTKRAARER